MRIYVSDFTDSGIKTISLTHKGSLITWDAKPYIRASRIEGAQYKPNPENDLVFREINLFFDSLPMERQDAIWQCYLDIHELFSIGYNPLSMAAQWQGLIERLYQQIPYEELHRWAATAGVIDLPLNLKTEYDEKDPVQLTYLRQDYFDLAVLAIACRPMVPIWGMYIPTLQTGEVENTFKEYVAVNLLYKTYIPLCPPYERLRRYIEASISSKGKQSNTFSALLTGLSSSSLPDWLLACTLVRRTSVVPISGSANGPNIITDIYQYVRNTLISSGNRRFAGPISDKQPRQDDKADQQESLAESYKIKQEVSDGDIMMAEVYLSDPLAVAQAIEPMIEPQMLSQCERAMQRLMMEEIHDHQLTLTQWVLHSAMSPRYVPLLTKPTLIKAMAATQAILWHWGFHDLAGLLGAVAIPVAEDEFISVQEARSDKLAKETVDKLVEIYPHNYMEKVKNATVRQTNAGYRAVDAFHRLLAGKDWQLLVPDELLNLTSRVPGSRKMYVPVDLRVQTANLLIHLHTARQEFAERARQRAGIPAAL